MGCNNCDQFDTEIVIHGPEQLLAVCRKILTAVKANTLRYSSFESDRELIGQPSFLILDLSAPLPDMIRYHFYCSRCGIPTVSLLKHIMAAAQSGR